MPSDDGGRKATANEIWHQELAREIEASCNSWISPMMVEAHELLEGRTCQERIARLVVNHNRSNPYCIDFRDNLA
jgi:hypothetical protein